MDALAAYGSDSDDSDDESRQPSQPQTTAIYGRGKGNDEQPSPKRARVTTEVAAVVRNNMLPPISTNGSSMIAWNEDFLARKP